MNYQVFGKTGLNVSRFGLGCMRFPKIKKPDGTKIIDQDKVNQMVQYAYENGINYFDTAFLYGGSEKALGQAIKNIPRDKIIITSKLPMARYEKYDDCQRFLDQSLNDLETDYIDFYLFHSMLENRWNKVKRDGLFKFMEKAKDKGIIKYIGFSFHDNLSLFKEMIDAYDWDMCQIQLNILDTKHQAGLEGLHYASEKGIPIVIMEPLRGGGLVNHVPNKVKQLASEHSIKRPVLEWAFRWLYDLPEVNVVLSGVNNLDQLKQNIDIVNHSSPHNLTQEDQEFIKAITEIFSKNNKIGCTHCNYCMPCSHGVDIPEIFGYYNGLSMASYQNYCKFQYTKFKHASGHGADKCIECKECEEKCPQHLPIIDTLKLAHKALFIAPNDK